MTPNKVKGSKNYRFDRVTPVGRITKSAKTSSKTEFRRRDGILTKLIESASLETLRMFRDGAISIEELVDADRSDELLAVGRRHTLQKPLILSVEEWLPYSAKAYHSRRRYKTSWDGFEKKAGIAEKHTVEHLSRINYDKLKSKWGASDTDWNRCRAMLSRFLTKHMGHVHHPFRLRVMSLIARGEEPEGRLPRVTPKQFWAIIEKAEERFQASYVAMAVLGVGPGEYLSIERSHLYPDERLVFVPGTKSRARRRTVAVDDRLWSWVNSAIPCPIKARMLRKYWDRACDAAGVENLWMYDLRHLSAQYAGDAGATDRDLAVHLGHTDPRMSHRYSRVVTARKVAGAVADRLMEAS